jgi:hypothetical protein
MNLKRGFFVEGKQGMLRNRGISEKICEFGDFKFWGIL